MLDPLQVLKREEPSPPSVVLLAATGNCVLPMLVFSRARIVARLMDRCVPEAIGTCTEMG